MVNPVNYGYYSKGRARPELRITRGGW